MLTLRVCRPSDLSTFVDFTAVKISIVAIFVYLLVSFMFFAVSTASVATRLACVYRFTPTLTRAACSL